MATIPTKPTPKADAAADAIFAAVLKAREAEQGSGGARRSERPEMPGLISGTALGGKVTVTVTVPYDEGFDKRIRRADRVTAKRTRKPGYVFMTNGLPAIGRIVISPGPDVDSSERFQPVYVPIKARHTLAGDVNAVAGRIVAELYAYWGDKAAADERKAQRATLRSGGTVDDASEGDGE